LDPIGTSALFDKSAPGIGDCGVIAINLASGKPQIKLTVPIAIMHRLYRLGQAYDLAHLRDFSSDVRLVIPGKESLRFVSMLRKLVALTNDQELHEHAGRLANEIESQESLTVTSVSVTTGRYHDERR
jgi:hypothetical protein